MNRRLTIAYVFSQYPRLTETFLHREVGGLRQAGLRVEIHALFPGPAPSEADSFRWWEATRLFVALPRELIRQPSLLRDGWRALRRARFRSTENFFATIWAVIYAVCRAPRFRSNHPDIIHGVWATESSTAAAVLSRLCGIPFSFGAHAFDIYKHGGDALLDVKLAAAAFVHTTTQANVAYLRQRVPAANIVLARRGLNRLPPPRRTERSPGVARILSVGRLTSKKGHIHQLAACRLLKQWGVRFEARIIGDGKLRQELQRQIDELGLTEIVTLCGAQPQELVQEAYDWADIFWHTGVVDARGDRDGLPNVIPEALAHQLPVISCREPGATEAVANKVTGLLVDITDPVALATAVRRLVEDEPLRRRLGEDGRRWVEENFVINKNSAILANTFRETAARHETRAKLVADAESALAVRQLAGNVPSRNAPITIAYILMKHPSWSQTFLAREIAELSRQGLHVEVHSLWRARSDAPPPTGTSSKLTIRYFDRWEAARLIVALPRELWRDPKLLADGWQMVARHRRTTWTDFLKNVWGAIFAVCRASEFRERRIRLVHGAWAASPATAAAILGRLCGVPFTFGAQAYDIYKHGGDQFLDSKLRAARLVHTTTRANAAYLRQRVPEAHIVLARRGLERVPPLDQRPRTPGPIRILSVARLVSIKGHLHQLAACALLEQWGVPFEARMVGDGELKRELQQRIESSGLTGLITLDGGLHQEQVQEVYHWADIFWHTGVVDGRGNRDGLPNVIPEAFAHQLPVISCSEPGATEAVTHEVTGLVVDITDPVALAKAVRRLAEDEPLRRRLGENGRRWVEENFMVRDNVAILAEGFREAIGERSAVATPEMIAVQTPRS